jgi:hypothetical protein
MLVGQQTTPWMIESMMGWSLAKATDPALAERLRGYILSTADYFLGANAMNQTFITGVGHRTPTAIFHMDAWYNGKNAYHPGLIPYGQWRKERPFGAGPWDHAWPYFTVYPAIDSWPGNERWFSNRCSPMHAEFTVHQNLGPAAAYYGFISAAG